MDEAEKARGERAGTPRRMTEPQDLPQEPSLRSTQKRTMNLDKPSAKLDLVVAEAAGMAAKINAGVCEIRCPVTGKWWPFRPSHDMTDAWEAAEKVGLFDKYYITKCCTDVSRWWLFSASRKPICSALTGPLAICGAILKNPKGKPDGL